MAAEEYRLVPAAAPTKRGPKTALYLGILNEFISSREVSVRVDLPGRTPTTVTRGLRRAIQNSHATVNVTLSGGCVYLHL